jgi:hypothetical protein
VPTTKMNAMVTAVVLALKSNASNATGDAIVRQDPSFTDQITRLNNGRPINSRAGPARSRRGRT